MSKDYYKILGVDKNANADELKKAFHKLAHQHHPDKKGGDEAKFKEVNEAYQALSDPNKRAQYDRFGTTEPGAGGFANGFGSTQGGFGGMNFDMNDLSDLFGGFGDMFGFSGGSASGGGNKQGSDLEMQAEIEFLEAAFGTTKKFKFRKTITCKHCHGNGAEPGAKIETCSTCQGTGRVTRIQRTILGAVQMQSSCPNCNGQGKKPSQTCRECSGTGVVREATELEIKIPAGINDGESVRFPRQGEAGINGAPAGDLYVRVRVKADKRFIRRGFDIITKLEINFSEAALGVKRNIETIDGQAELEIAKGLQSGEIIKLRGHGVSKLNSNERGDHLVEISIKTPTKLNRQQQEALENLKSLGL